MISHNIASQALEGAHRFPFLAREVAMFDCLVKLGRRGRMQTPHHVGLVRTWRAEDSCHVRGWISDSRVMDDGVNRGANSRCVCAPIRLCALDNDIYASLELVPRWFGYLVGGNRNGLQDFLTASFSSVAVSDSLRTLG